MNEKYDIERILRNTHNRFLMQPGYEDTRPCQYQIYFQFADKPDQYYVIRAEVKTAPLSQLIFVPGLDRR